MITIYTRAAAAVKPRQFEVIRYTHCMDETKKEEPQTGSVQFENSRTDILGSGYASDTQKTRTSVEVHGELVKKKLGPARYERLRAARAGLLKPTKRYVEAKGYAKIDGAFYAAGVLPGTPAPAPERWTGMGLLEANRLNSSNASAPVTDELQQMFIDDLAAEVGPTIETRISSPGDIRNMTNAPDLSKLDLFAQDLSAGEGRELGSWRFWFTLVGLLVLKNRLLQRLTYRWAMFKWKTKRMLLQALPPFTALKHQLYLLQRMGLRPYLRLLQRKHIRPAPLREVSWPAASQLRQPNGAYLACLPPERHPTILLNDGAYSLEDLITETQKQGLPLGEVLCKYMYFMADVAHTYAGLISCDHCDGRGRTSCFDPADNNHFRSQSVDQTAAEMRGDPKYRFVERTFTPEDASVYRRHGSYYTLHFECVPCSGTGKSPNPPTYGDASQLVAVKLGLTKKVKLSENMKAQFFPRTEEEIVQGFQGVMARHYTLKPEAPKPLLSNLEQHTLNRLSREEFLELLDDVQIELERLRREQEA